MRSENEIIELFKEAVSEVDNNTKIANVTPSTELASLGLDSVMTMEVIGVLEERLNVRFPDEDLATIRSMSDLTQLVNRLEG
ncbi:MAG: acyl carrier protein [Myxococcales bacterium]|nr:acyl carrier protein [Myxococcales bacterium]